jgi:hypothetical protein
MGLKYPNIPCRPSAERRHGTVRETPFQSSRCLPEIAASTISRLTERYEHEAHGTGISQAQMA